MPFIQALEYVVSSRRPGGNTVVLNSIRVTPVPFVGSGNGVDFVDLSYNATSQFPVGSIPVSTSRQVFGFFAPEEFEIHRSMFQTEAPIEIEWQLDANNPNSLTQLTVRTTTELPGEGPVDTS